MVRPIPLPFGKSVSLMAPFIPKFVTFDRYGALTRFQMTDMAWTLFSDAAPSTAMERCVADFTACWLDERTTWCWSITFDIETAQRLYQGCADMPAGLAKVARVIPLVILSNASDDQTQSNVDKIGAVPPGVYDATGTGLHAAPACIRVHARQPRLQSGGRAARVIQPALRPDVGVRHRRAVPASRLEQRSRDQLRRIQTMFRSVDTALNPHATAARFWPGRLPSIVACPAGRRRRCEPRIEPHCPVDPPPVRGEPCRCHDPLPPPRERRTSMSFAIFRRIRA